jgi:hypothetical protein
MKLRKIAIDAWDRFFFAPEPYARLAAFRIVVFTLAARTLDGTFYQIDRYAKSDGREIGLVWNPIWIIESLGLSIPSPETTARLDVIARIVVCLGIVGFMTRIATILAAPLLLIAWGLAYSVGQAHHDKVALMFAIAALAISPCGKKLSVDAWIARRFHPGPGPCAAICRDSAFAAWPLAFIRWTIAAGYFFAGASKLALGGTAWLNGFTLQGLMHASNAPWAPALADSPAANTVYSIGLLATQIGFPLVLVAKWTRWFFLPMAVVFHVLAAMTLGTGPYDTLWALLVVFLPIERIPNMLLVGARNRPIVGGLIAVVAVGLVATYAVYIRERHMSIVQCLTIVPVIALIRRARRILLH